MLEAAATAAGLAPPVLPSTTTGSRPGSAERGALPVAASPVVPEALRSSSSSEEEDASSPQERSQLQGTLTDTWMTACYVCFLKHRSS